MNFRSSAEYPLPSNLWQRLKLFIKHIYGLIIMIRLMLQDLPDEDEKKGKE